MKNTIILFKVTNVLYFAASHSTKRADQVKDSSSSTGRPGNISKLDFKTNLKYLLKNPFKLYPDSSFVKH